jgi:diguanylate cyclase (GGDEF)-like protein/PAS domain S-box-containing protein
MAKEPQSDLQRLQFVLDASQLALWDWDMQTGSIVVDNRWALMLGRTLKEVEPVTIHSFEALVHPADRPRLFEMVEAHSLGKTPYFDGVFRMQHKDGHWVWIQGRGLVVQRDKSGHPLRMTGVHDDISEGREKAFQLQVRTSQLEAAQRLGQLGSWFWNLATDEVTWSEELFTMQGFDPTEPVPPASQHAQLFTEDSWAELSQALHKVSQEGIPYELELEMDSGTGPMGWMLARGEAVTNEFGEIVGVFGIAQDITARKHTEESLRTMALQDDLSELGNRQALKSTLEFSLNKPERKKTPIACLLVDLDNFKNVNDRYGHAAGDRVIQISANRMARLTRKGDSAFRIGGDEFVVLLDSAKTLDAAVSVAQRISDALAENMSIDDHAVSVTASVGIALSEPGIGQSELLRRADVALYEAKRSGKNRVTTWAIELEKSDAKG